MKDSQFICEKHWRDCNDELHTCSEPRGHITPCICACDVVCKEDDKVSSANPVT